MKKVKLILIMLTAFLSGFSQLATVNQQTVQNVKLDTIANRLVRGNFTGAASAANQVISTASLTNIKVKLDTTNQDLRLINTSVTNINTTLGGVATRVRQDTVAARLLSIKNINDSLRHLIWTLNTRTSNNGTVVVSSGTAQVIAGESHIGQTGGSYSVIPITITTSTPAYSSGDNIGGINTVTGVFRVNAGSVSLENIFIWDKSNQKASITIDFWNSTPNAGTYTDNQAEIIAGDQAKFLGSVSIGSSSYVTQGTIARATVSLLDIMMKAAGGSSSLFFTIATTSTPSYGTTSDLVIGLGIKQN